MEPRARRPLLATPRHHPALLVVLDPDLRVTIHQAPRRELCSGLPTRLMAFGSL